MRKQSQNESGQGLHYISKVLSNEEVKTYPSLGV